MLLRIIQRSSPLLKQPLSFSFGKLDQKPDLYSLLELKPNSTQDQIAYNYHKLAKQSNHNGNDMTSNAKLLN